jgi:hypothetical protein
VAGKDGGRGWSLRGTELFGLILILIGIVYFLGNANIVHISWNLIWPILIVAVGAAILLSALRPRSDLPGTVDVPREGVDQLELDLSLGAGTFRVHGGATNLVEVRSDRQDIVPRLDRQGNRGRVRLSQDMRWFPLGVTGHSDWDIRSASDVPTALTVSGGAGRFDLDLSDMRIVDARMSVGAAEARITLPRPTGDVAVRVSSGAASVTIQVPAGVEARVVASGGLLQLKGNTETPGYAAARDRVSVSVSGGASQVTVV